MSDKKPKAVAFTTPVGVFVYPKLNTPDTKFKAEGVYSVKLRVPADEAEAFKANYLKAREVAAEAQKQALKDELAAATDGKVKAKLKKALAEFKDIGQPFEDVVDDEGEPTGDVLIKVQMKASYKDKKTGKDKALKPDFFDATGKQLKVAPTIWGGTEGCVAGVFSPFFNAKNEFAFSLRMQAVQIIKLVSEGGGNRDASGYGFGAQEGGFEGSDEAGEEAPFQDHTGDDATGEPDSDEF
jgi:hypothetical protein